jgi:hypothetical protein
MHLPGLRPHMYGEYFSPAHMGVCYRHKRDVAGRLASSQSAAVLGHIR